MTKNNFLRSGESAPTPNLDILEQCNEINKLDLIDRSKLKPIPPTASEKRSLIFSILRRVNENINKPDSIDYGRISVFLGKQKTSDKSNQLNTEKNKKQTTSDNIVVFKFDRDFDMNGINEKSSGDEITQDNLRDHWIAVYFPLVNLIYKNIAKLEKTKNSVSLNSFTNLKNPLAKSLYNSLIDFFYYELGGSFLLPLNKNETKISKFNWIKDAVPKSYGKIKNSFKNYYPKNQKKLKNKKNKKAIKDSKSKSPKDSDFVYQFLNLNTDHLRYFLVISRAMLAMSDTNFIAKIKTDLNLQRYMKIIKINFSQANNINGIDFFFKYSEHQLLFLLDLHNYYKKDKSPNFMELHFLDNHETMVILLDNFVHYWKVFKYCDQAKTIVLTSKKHSYFIPQANFLSIFTGVSKSAVAFNGIQPVGKASRNIDLYKLSGFPKYWWHHGAPDLFWKIFYQIPKKITDQNKFFWQINKNI